MSNERPEDLAILQKLDKPGAGIPLPQRLFLRLYLGPFVSARSDWAADNAAFEKLNQKIIKEVAAIPADMLETRVLVPPLQGLEDSSRYWSAVMTLEHVMIVGKGISGIVQALSNGIVPDYKPDTAKVKPKGEGNPQQVIEDFKNFTETLMAETDKGVKDRLSKTKLHHPWFGPFAARQWHWLLAMHSGIHLKQLREIVKGLPKSKAA